MIDLLLPPEGGRRTARLEARLPHEVLERLKRATEIQGRSLTDFVVAAAAEAACRTIEQTEIIRLSREDQLLIAEAIINPPEPGPALLKAGAGIANSSARNDSRGLPFRGSWRPARPLIVSLRRRGSGPVFANASNPGYPPEHRQLFYRCRGLVTAILMDAADRIAQGAATAFAMLVDAKDEQGVAFYRHNEFRTLATGLGRCFCPSPPCKKRFLQNVRPNCYDETCPDHWLVCETPWTSCPPRCPTGRGFSFATRIATPMRC